MRLHCEAAQKLPLPGSEMSATLGDINVVCTDIEESLRFYRDGLGLAEMNREDGAVRLALGGVTLLLLPYADQPRREWDYEVEATISFDILVDDLESAVMALEASGGERTMQLGGGAGWAVRDPDGNVIEVIQR